MAAIHRLSSAADAASWYRRADVRTDLGYWFFTPLVSGTVTRIAVGLALFAAVWLGGGSVAEAALYLDESAGSPVQVVVSPQPLSPDGIDWAAALADGAREGGLKF